MRYYSLTSYHSGVKLQGPQEMYFLCKTALDLIVLKKQLAFSLKIESNYYPGQAILLISTQLRTHGTYLNPDCEKDSATLGKDPIHKLSGFEQPKKNGSKFHRRC